MVTAAAVYPVFSLPIVCSIKLQDASMWLPCIVSSVYRSFVALCAMIALVWLHAAGPRVTARLTILVRALFFICMPEINCTGQHAPNANRHGRGGRQIHTAIALVVIDINQ
jgi:hypothetical protein